ncbi:hypothetical protein [Microcoleus sp.]|uniref:hypothetical protein n=1 Tax=Microcoleus sp. TaxID=44472 RepID=UPI0035245576
MTNIYHDRIPQLFAHFDEYQEFYLVQELIAGHDLSHEFNPPHQIGAQGVQFNENQVIQLLYDILDVLRSGRRSHYSSERSPFLTIQKGDRSFYNQSWRSLLLNL